MNPKRIIDRARKRSAQQNKVRWDRERKRIEAERPRRFYEMEREKVLNRSTEKKGSYIGTLEWRERSGKVRKWVIRRGPRFNQMLIDGVEGPKCVTRLMARLRRNLAVYFRSNDY